MMRVPGLISVSHTRATLDSHAIFFDTCATLKKKNWTRIGSGKVTFFLNLISGYQDLKLQKSQLHVKIFDFSNVKLLLVEISVEMRFHFLKTRFWVDNKLQNELAFRSKLQHGCLQFLLSFIFQLSLYFAQHLTRTTQLEFFFLRSARTS